MPEFYSRDLLNWPYFKSLCATLTAVLGVLAVSALYYFVDGSLAAERAQATVNAKNITRSIEQDIGHTVEMIDQSLLAALSGMALPELASLRPSLQQAILFDGAINTTSFGRVLISDRDGNRLYGWPDDGTQPVNVATRPFFLFHKSDPDRGLHMSGPFRTQVDGKWTLFLSRRVPAADGSFGGIVVGTLDLEPVLAGFNQLDLAERDSLTLLMTGGRVLADRNSVKNTIGMDLSRARLFEKLPLASSGTYEARTLVTGTDKVLVYRTVGAYPLVVLFGFSTADVIKHWFGRHWAFLTILVIFMVVSAALGLLLLKELKRRGHAQHLARMREREAKAIAAEIRLLTDHSRDLMLHLDWDGRRRFVSPASRQILGREPEELLKGDSFEFVHPDDQVPVRRGLDDLKRGAAFVAISYRLLHRDGRWRDVEAHGQTLPDGAGVVLVVRDVSERVELEGRLRQAHRMEALGQLTAGVSHDFNNMLQAQLGTLEILIDGLGDQPLARQLAKKAYELGERGARLTSQLRSFSRQQLLMPVPIEVRAFLDAFAQTAGGVLGASIQLCMIVEEGLPHLHADNAHLESALMNLAVNARDAMQEGGVLTIEARAHADGACVMLSIRDTGVGMDPATLARACEPFFTTKGLNGTGLGLASVQGFASQSGGSLRVESAPGEGTCIGLILPACHASEMAGVPEGAGQHHTGRLLLVDDLPEVLEAVTTVLDEAGFEVETAASGEAAMELILAGGGFDCLVTDHLMPGMTGEELIGHARAVIPGLPALLITGWADIEGIDQLSELTAVLCKPFKRDVLIEHVSQLIAFGHYQALDLQLSESE